MKDVQSADSSSAQRSASTATRPAVMWSAAGFGGLFAISPFVLTLWFNDNFGAWEVIAATTLTNIGTTLALASVLFLLERNFTQTVTEAVAETARTEVAAQTKDIRATAQALQQKVSDIAKELDERRQARVAERETVIRDLRDGVSFETVASALERATDLGALRYGPITIPAGADLDSPRVRVFWGDIVRSSFGTGNVFDDAPPAIAIAYEVPYDEQTRGGHTPASARWRYGQSATDALDELIRQMQKAGYIAAAAKVRAEVFALLADALEEAMAARTGADNAWLRGRLDEWITDGWAITDQGLENRDSIQIPAAEFPDSRFEATPAATKTRPAKFDPPVPAGVNVDLWAFAIERSRHKFTGSHSVAIAASGMGPVAYSSTTSARVRGDWPPT